MKKDTFDFTPLKESKKKVDAIAAEVAKAEAEILLADEALAVAKRDDGTIAPEQLVKRIDDADRALKIRGIEANRAAAKLQEVEGGLHRVVVESIEPVVNALSTRYDEEKSRIRKLLTGILGESVGDCYEVTTVIGMAESVTRIGGHTRTINRLKTEIGQGFTGANEQLAEAIIQAEQLL